MAEIVSPEQTESPAIPETETAELAQEQPSAEETPAPDYKALYEESSKASEAFKAEVASLQAELKALRIPTITANGSQTDANLLYEIRDRLEALEQSNGVVANGVVSGETEGVSEKLRQIAMQRQAATAQRDFQFQYAALWNELVQAANGPDGKPLLDIYQAPELEDARQLWAASHKNQYPGGLERAIRQVERARNQVERKQAAAALAAVAEKSQKDAKTKIEKAGAFDLDTGAGAPTARVTADTIDLLYAQGKVSDAKYRRFLQTGEVS